MARKNNKVSTKENTNLTTNDLQNEIISTDDRSCGMVQPKNGIMNT